MNQNNHTIDNNMSRLSISEQQQQQQQDNNNGSSSPTFTSSRTPPPPGFAAAAATADDVGHTIDRSDTPNTCKSTSFNNLAMALGTGLAECMDDSTTAVQQPPSQIQLPPGLIPERSTSFTPDNYTRQSRHSVSRLMGSNNVGGGGGGGIGGK